MPSRRTTTDMETEERKTRRDDHHKHSDQKSGSDDSGRHTRSPSRDSQGKKDRPRSTSQTSHTQSRSRSRNGDEHRHKHTSRRKEITSFHFVGCGFEDPELREAFMNSITELAKKLRINTRSEGDIEAGMIVEKYKEDGRYAVGIKLPAGTPMADVGGIPKLYQILYRHIDGFKEEHRNDSIKDIRNPYNPIQ